MTTTTKQQHQQKENESESPRVSGRGERGEKRSQLVAKDFAEHLVTLAHVGRRQLRGLLLLRQVRVLLLPLEILAARVQQRLQEKQNSEREKMKKIENQKI